MKAVKLFKLAIFSLAFILSTSGSGLADESIPAQSLPPQLLPSLSQASDNRQTEQNQLGNLEASTPHEEGQRAINYRVPPRSYEQVHVAGWPVFVESTLFQTQLQIANQALTRLEGKLGEAMAVLPDQTRNDFTGLTFFLMKGGLRPDGRPINGLEFCGKDAPDFHARLDPRWRKCIVIHSADNYAHLTDFWALKSLVHEFSHAHQLLHWEEKQPDILGAWQNAKSRGLYRNVQDLNGHILPKAFALTNQLEYFAELSCIYFIGCNYYPFNRVQLESYDPVGYAMIRKMWSING